MSPKEILLLASTLSVPIFSWTIFGFLERMAGWLYHFDGFELLRLASYGVVNSLAETIVATLLVAMFVIVSVRGRFRSHRCAAAVALSLALAGVAAAFHLLSDVMIESLPRLALFALGSVAALVAICYFAIQSGRLARLLIAFAERARVLAVTLYLPMSVAGIVVLTVGILS